MGDTVVVLTVSPGIGSPATHTYDGSGTPLKGTNGLNVAAYADFPTATV